MLASSPMLLSSLWKNSVFVFWLSLAFLFLFAEKQKWSSVVGLKKYVNSSLYRVEIEIGRGVYLVKSYFLSWQDYNKVLKELQNLRQERLIYQQLQWQLQEQQRKINLYHDLLNVQLPSQFDYKTVRVYADTRNFFSKTIVIHQGSHDGLDKGMAVIGTYGIVGQIIDVYPHKSRILLVQDYSSMLPVVVKNSHFRGITRGNGDEEASIDFLPFDHDLQHGDVLVTSDFHKDWPVGIPVGKIKLDSEKNISVVFFENEHLLEYVRVAYRKKGQEYD